MATRSARRSPSPASRDTTATTPGSAARPHRPPTPPGPAHTSAAQSEANAAFTVFREIPNTRAISEIGNSPTGATAGSPPSPPRSTLASSLAHSQGSPGSWSIFSCRAVVSIQLPSISVIISGRCLRGRSTTAAGPVRWIISPCRMSSATSTAADLSNTSAVLLLQPGAHPGWPASMHSPRSSSCRSRRPPTGPSRRSRRSPGLARTGGPDRTGRSRCDRTRLLNVLAAGRHVCHVRDAGPFDAAERQSCPCT